MPFTNSIVGGVTLVRPAIRSPNYVQSDSGWSINREGDAEFNDLTVRGKFLGSDFVISQDGIFFYDGDPASGNMVGSWASRSGDDPYGNAYSPGLAIYDNQFGSQIFLGINGQLVALGFSGNAILMFDGKLIFSTLIQSLSATIKLDTDTNSLIADSGLVADNGGLTTRMILNSTTSSPTEGDQDTYPRTVSMETFGESIANHYVSGAVVKSNESGETGETWHTVGTSGNASYNTGWAASTSFNGSGNSPISPMRYRKDAEDNCWIEGVAVNSGSSASLFTLPDGYFNPNTRSLLPANFLVGSTVSSGWVQVTETGIVNATSSISGHSVGTNTQIYINGSFPLGNVS